MSQRQIPIDINYTTHFPFSLLIINKHTQIYETN